MKLETYKIKLNDNELAPTSLSMSIVNNHTLIYTFGEKVAVPQLGNSICKLEFELSGEKEVDYLWNNPNVIIHYNNKEFKIQQVEISHKGGNKFVRVNCVDMPNAHGSFPSRALVYAGIQAEKAPKANHPLTKAFM
jgi:hypothetical protein